MEEGGQGLDRMAAKRHEGRREGDLNPLEGEGARGSGGVHKTWRRKEPKKEDGGKGRRKEEGWGGGIQAR